MKRRSANAEMSPTPRSDSESRSIRRKRSESVLSEALSSIPEQTSTTTPSNRHVRSLRPRRASSQYSTEQMGLEPCPDPLQIDADSSPLPIDSAIALSENGSRNKKVRFSYAGLPNPSLNDSHAASSPIINAVSKKTKARRSLPPRLPSHASSYIEEVQFTPLIEALDNRTRRRMRRNHLSEETNSIDQHRRADVRKDQELEILRRDVEEKDKLCKEFEMELEERRLMGIEINDEDKDKDIRLKSMEQDLTKLRAKLAAYEQTEEGSTSVNTPDHSDFGAIDAEDDEDMDFVELADIGLTQEDVIPDTTFAEMTYQPLPPPLAVVPDPAFEHQVRHFEEVVKTLTKQAADAKAALQIVEIELRNLGFTDGNASPEDVLGAIRTAFRQARLELGEVLPCHGNGLDNVSDETNGSFLPYLLEHIRGLAAELLAEGKSLARKEELIALLRGQHKGLLDKLSEVQDRNTRLQRVTEKMDEDIDEWTRDNAFLSEMWKSSVTGATALEDEITKLDAYVREMEGKIAEHAVAYEELRLGFERAAGELQDASNLIDSLQEEHKETLEVLEQEKEDAKEAFETELGNERIAKEEAQNDANAKQTLIVDFEQRAEEMTDLIDGLREQLVAAQNYGLAENTQREAIQTLVNDKDEVIKGLETKLHGAGSEANELRIKLFAEQSMLEQVAVGLTDREEQYQADMAAEIARRTRAEGAVATQGATIAKLESKVGVLGEANMELEEKTNLLQQREKHIAKLDGEVHKATNNYSTLQVTSQAEIADLQGQIDHLEWSVSHYEDRCAEMEDQLGNESRAYEDQIEENDAQLEDLRANVEDLKEENSVLERLRTSLEERVSHEAWQMLDFQNKVQDDVAILNASIEAQKRQYQELQQASAERESALQEDITYRDDRIVELNNVVAEKNASLSTMQSEILDLKSKLVRMKDIFYSHAEQATTARQQVHGALDNVRQTSSMLQEESAKRIEGQSMEVEGIVDGVLEPKARRSRRKAYRDSGIMMEVDAEL